MIQMFDIGIKMFYLSVCEKRQIEYKMFDIKHFWTIVGCSKIKHKMFDIGYFRLDIEIKRIRKKIPPLYLQQYFFELV